MSFTRSLTPRAMLDMQKRGQDFIDAANTWSPAAREASAESRHEHMVPLFHNGTKWQHAEHCLEGLY